MERTFLSLLRFVACVRVRVRVRKGEKLFENQIWKRGTLHSIKQPSAWNWATSLRNGPITIKKWDGVWSMYATGLPCDRMRQITVRRVWELTLRESLRHPIFSRYNWNRSYRYQYLCRSDRSDDSYEKPFALEEAKTTTKRSLRCLSLSRERDRGRERERERERELSDKMKKGSKQPFQVYFR